MKYSYIKFYRLQENNVFSVQMSQCFGQYIATAVMAVLWVEKRMYILELLVLLNHFLLLTSTLLEHKLAVLGHFGVYTRVIRDLLNSYSSCTSGISQLQALNITRKAPTHTYKRKLVQVGYACTRRMPEFDSDEFTHPFICVHEKYTPNIFLLVHGNPTFRSVLSLCSCTFIVIKRKR